MALKTIIETEKLTDKIKIISKILFFGMPPNGGGLEFRYNCSLESI